MILSLIDLSPELDRFKHFGFGLSVYWWYRIFSEHIVVILSHPCGRLGNSVLLVNWLHYSRFSEYNNPLITQVKNYSITQVSNMQTHLPTFPRIVYKKSNRAVNLTSPKRTSNAHKLVFGCHKTAINQRTDAREVVLLTEFHNILPHSVWLPEVMSPASSGLFTDGEVATGVCLNYQGISLPQKCFLGNLHFASCS